MSKLIHCTYIFVLCFSSLSVAQDVIVKGQFLDDSIQVGEHVRYVLYARYSSDMELIFPDSNYSFKPFEYLKKDYYPTTSDTLSSFDSVVYYLTTFEIDQVQYLSIPVFDMSNGDSLSHYPSMDSITLIEEVKVLPDSLALKENTIYQHTEVAFNHVYMIIGVVAFFLMLLVTWLMAGKRIYRSIKRYYLKKTHKNFILKYRDIVGELKTEPNALKIEYALAFWKGYMEDLEKAPYTKLTTRELVTLEGVMKVESDLKGIDKSIYGNAHDTKLIDYFENLEYLTIGKFNKIIAKEL